MKYTLLFLLLVSVQVSAASLDAKSLEELVVMSDHIVEVEITGVDMVGSSGLVNDDAATTGPGSANEIRLHARVISVLKSTTDNFPAELTVSLWRLWNYSLKQVKDASLNEKAIFLLKGEEIFPVYPGLFRRGMNELQHIRIILGKEELRKQFQP